MDTLRSFYKRLLNKGVVGIIILVFLIHTKAMPFAENIGGWTGWIVRSLVTPTALAMILWGYESLLRNHLWRIFNPKLDYRGIWQGVTTYAHLERCIGDDIPELPIKREHGAKIVQDSISFKLVPTQGDNMVSWQAEAIELTAAGQIIMAYSVT